MNHGAYRMHHSPRGAKQRKGDQITRAEVHFKARPGWPPHPKNSGSPAAGVTSKAGRSFEKGPIRPGPRESTLLHFLGAFDAKRRVGDRIEPRFRNHAAAFIAFAIGAIFDALERSLDFAQRIAFAL